MKVRANRGSRSAHAWSATVTVLALVVGSLGVIPILTLGSDSAFADGAPPAVAPLTIGLASSSSTFAAGSSVLLTATTDVDVAPTSSTIRIVDVTTGATLATCTNGAVCSANTSFYTGPAIGTPAAAANGGAATVRVGQAGEAAVKAAFDIGEKQTALVGTRTRIFDGLNLEQGTVSEVKNVNYQAFTQQLKDTLAYAVDKGLQFNLYVRQGTVISGPLEIAHLDPSVPLNIVRFLP